jgi:hypothetical protein
MENIRMRYIFTIAMILITIGGWYIGLPSAAVTTLVIASIIAFLGTI